MEAAMTLLNQPTTIEIADPALCAAACREIYAQRPRWRGWRLNGQPPFYTLGAVSYLDLRFRLRSVDEYLSDAGLLWQWAGDAVRTIFERVRCGLEPHLGAPVEYPAAVPTPGFHIFIGAAIPKTDCSRNLADCGSSHFDLQYDEIPWDRWYTHVDFENAISLTLALKLPAAGGGLTFWDEITLERVRAASERLGFSDIYRGYEKLDIPSVAHATPSATIPYAVGSLVLHDSHLLHQMAGIPKISVTDERITLQGHGVLADGAWRLFW
jgi:hypothetical protein